MSAPSIHQILIRLNEQGAMFCPMCRYGPKHVVNIECLEKFWRPLFPRKLNADLMIRGCFYYYGAPLMYVYAPEEFGYAVAAVHYGFALCILRERVEPFWSHIIHFLEENEKVRPGTMGHTFGLILHVLETLAWRSSTGDLFPMPLICWYFPIKLFEKHKPLMDIVSEIRIESYESTKV